MPGDQSLNFLMILEITVAGEVILAILNDNYENLIEALSLPL